MLFTQGETSNKREKNRNRKKSKIQKVGKNKIEWNSSYQKPVTVPWYSNGIRKYHDTSIYT